MVPYSCWRGDLPFPNYGKRLYAFKGDQFFYYLVYPWAGLPLGGGSQSEVCDRQYDSGREY